MSAQEWKQLNLPETSTYIEFPLAFTGNKAPDFEGLNMSCQYILAEIHTMNKIYREPAKLTYEYFISKYGMSKETIAAALDTLKKRGIIERVKQSRYKILPKYNKKNYVEIDVCWLKHEWEINGKKKRLSRSRLLALALLKRGCSNPKTGGEFVSSQARIGKALNMPRTTAGDSIREIIAAGAIQVEKQDGQEARKRGCSLFKVNPDIMNVVHPRLNIAAVKAFFQEPTAEELHKRLMLDTEYKTIIEHINKNSDDTITEIRRAKGNDTPKLAALEADTVALREKLKGYFEAHKIKREIFPPGFFKCDITDKTAI